jgi:hypothetical protein
MRCTCTNPRCQDGTVATSLLPGSSANRQRALCRTCPTCGGRGTIEETEDDLRSVGVVLWGPDDEDFRSLPLHWSP